MEDNQKQDHNPSPAEKAGKRIAKWILIGIAAWTAIYFMENFVLIPSLIFWSMIALSTLIPFVWQLYRADFKFQKLSWYSREHTFDSAFDENENLKIGPRIGTSVGLIIINFLSYGWILVLLVLGINYIPAENAEKKTAEVYKVESTTSLRSGSSTKYFFYWDGFKEHFTIPAKTYSSPSSISFRCYKGILGFDVIQRRIG